MGMPMGSDDWRNDATAALFDAIVTLEDRDEAARFFRDLCTYRELDEMSSRWAVVRNLVEGVPYREIHGRTGASTATITRINQWLQHGTGGYRAMLERLGLVAAPDEPGEASRTGRTTRAANDIGGDVP